jgi:hypothetical protein
MGQKVPEKSGNAEPAKNCFCEPLTPATPEGEGVTEDGPDMLFHFRSKQRAGAEQPGSRFEAEFRTIVRFPLHSSLQPTEQRTLL